MSNAKTLALILSSVTFTGSSLDSIGATMPLNSNKNILFIAVDDLKPLIGAYGDPIAKTPNIDRLAAMGTLFTNAYCQQAVSGPSRASLLTGICPDGTQVWDLKTLIRDKNPNALTIPQYFSQNGFVSFGIGKIYDPRSVDKKLDSLSWSTPYVNFENYYNQNYESPAYSQYQDPITRKKMAELEEEFAVKGMNRSDIRKSVTVQVKPSVECVDIADDAYSDGAIAKGAVEFISSCDTTKNYFWAVGFKKPHLPFCAPKKYWDLYNRASMPLAEYRQKAVGSPDFAYHQSGELVSYTDIPDLISFSDINNAILDDEKARELIHGYYAAISYMDAQLGKVLDALNSSPFAKNTIIVLWGDHGWHLGDHGLWNKHTNFEQATHAPLIIYDPEIGHSTVKHPVEFIDIFPTICEGSSIPVPSNLDGESLLPLMRGEKQSAKTHYAVSQFPRENKMGYSLRSNRYRYTVWVDWSNKKTNPEKVFAEELYDYKLDPNETKNLIGDRSYTKALKQMRAYWQEYKTKRIK